MKLYRIANLNVKMQVNYEPLLSQSIPYIIDSCDNIDLDLSKMDYDTKLKNYQEMYYSLNKGECEYMMYGSLFYTELIKHNGILLHSSCVVKDGFAYLFSAPSGTGKSTHTQLWLKNLSNTFILNDDKPAILIIDGKLYAAGTPFSGKTNQNVNAIYPIKAISFIHRSKENNINLMENKDIIFNMMNQTIRPNSEESINKFFDTLDFITKNIRFYSLGCNMNDDACILSYKVLSGENND